LALAVVQLALRFASAEAADVRSHEVQVRSRNEPAVIILVDQTGGVKTIKVILDGPGVKSQPHGELLDAGSGRSVERTVDPECDLTQADAIAPQIVTHGAPSAAQRGGL
jgi:hypothetical protein